MWYVCALSASGLFRDFTFFFQGGTLMLQRSLGPISLLIANAMSMVVRIAFTGSYIRKRFVRLKLDTHVKLLSKSYFFVSSLH